MRGKWQIWQWESRLYSTKGTIGKLILFGAPASSPSRNQGLMMAFCDKKLDGTWWNMMELWHKGSKIIRNSLALTILDFTGFHITFWGSKKPLNPAVAFKVLQHKSFFGGIQGFAFLNLSGDERMRQHTAVPKHKQTDNLTGFWGPMGTHKTSSNGHGLRACTPGGHQNIAGKWMLISPKKWFFIFFWAQHCRGNGLPCRQAKYGIYINVFKVLAHHQICDQLVYPLNIYIYMYTGVSENVEPATCAC